MPDLHSKDTFIP